ncbi:MULTISPECIES: PDR/VanB family oxidoreductase [unclassified Rhodococcus (in: high G+C Gram-positive bacteria)]|uniref:PDR/VanB family oxidoreductase n=1 Tax=unclassified Rhodococcus (in: high G+C Gram-positive bacteria) TaxID=192944 RepID=UPI00092AD262|nr:PDR/VanB family oxidoreductase [Rhodococcus sp. M8]OLL16590.1 oxidoreductase [Rhodococcus sp. M8]QPG46661.1 oxidoreductase [Rhodococcus sp. M8]
MTFPEKSSPADEFGTDLEIVERTEPADGVVALCLRHPDGGPLPPWSPGAHIDLVLDEDLVRQYSLCGDPADTGTWRIAVLREADGRGGSQYVHDKLAVGDRVRVHGPRNTFDLAPAPRYLFLAGGIGITPIVPMIAAAEAAGADWSLVYGGRRRASMAFADDLVTRYPGRVTLVPQDERGPLDLPSLLGDPRPGTLVYCCGPAGLLDAVTTACADRPAGSLRIERFAAKEQSAPVRSDGFEVELALSGTTVTVAPDESVLDAVAAAGVQVLSSCREGTCGTCETTVLAGTVDHRDSLLTPEEQAAHDTMLICVSRAACPRLVLEL